MKKYLLALPIFLFPYSLLFGLYCLYTGFLMESVFQNNGYLLILALFLCTLASLAFTGALCARSLAKKTDAAEMAKLNMIVKLVHIPAYIAIFLLGAVMLISVWGIGFTIVFFLHDVAAIAMTGFIGAVAVVRAGAEGRILRRDAVLYAIGQFLFCIDIAACILLYLRVRGKRLPAERVDVRPAEEQPEGQGNKL